MAVSRMTGTPPPPLIEALRRLLRPLIRLLISQQVPYTYLSGMLKSVFVEVASHDFPVKGKRQTDSRVSLLTGVHRKDVKRLRGEENSEFAPPPVVSLGAQLVARWTALPEYLDEEGKPRPLPRHGDEGAAASFEGLVRTVSTDIRPRVVLDEWLRLGIVRIDKQDCVALNVEAFVPEKGFDEKAYYFGRNLHDHLAACVHNLLGEPPPFLERSVYYDGLTPASVEELTELSKKLGTEALRTVNRRALALQHRDSKRSDARHRITFGVYFFRAKSSKAQDDEESNGAG
jgi:hypothetical protein